MANSSWRYGSRTLVLAALGVVLALPRTVAASSCRIVQVAPGSNYALGLRDDGTVVAWGDNSKYQLGTSTVTSSVSPIDIPGLSNVVQLAAGVSHSLALDRDGQLWSWGTGQQQQLGFGVSVTTVKAPTRVNVVPLSAIAAGDTSSLALTRDGNVLEWGARENCSYYHCTGQGDPVQVAGLSGMKAITAHAGFVFAIDSHDELVTWTNRSGAGLTTIAGLSRVVATAVGNAHFMAVDDQGVLWTWGNNSQGQLGNGTKVTDLDPLAIPLTDIEAVAAGDDHCVVLRRDGSVWTWGANTEHQSSSGSSDAELTPVRVLPPGSASSVAAGRNTSFAISPDGEVTVWGSENVLTLGATVPLELPLERNRVSVAAGSLHNLATGSSGDLLAWGSNLFGQLGDGTLVDPGSVVHLGTLADVRVVSASGEHTLAITGDGKLWAWGNNSFGQVGNDSTVIAPSPVAIGGLADKATAIAAGPYHSLAIDAKGAIYAWGNNWYGQLGLGDSGYGANRGVPQRVSIASPSPAIAIAAGAYHSLAVLADGTLWAWGNNDYGQLGLGHGAEGISSVVPTLVDTLDGVAVVDAGFYHNLAVRRDGTVWSWGSNAEGQLGTGGPDTGAAAPVQVAGLSGIVAVAGGQWHSLALAAGGTIWAWGSNSYGQLGNGTTTNAPLPVPVSQVGGAIAISAGSLHSVAVVGLGRIRVWGDNSYRQLGVTPLRPVSLPMVIGLDAIPGSVGTSVFAVKAGNDVLLDFSDTAVTASIQVYRDSAKEALGQSALGSATALRQATDAGALARGGLDFYVMRGLSACSQIPGP